MKSFTALPLLENMQVCETKKTSENLMSSEFADSTCLILKSQDFLGDLLF